MAESKIPKFKRGVTLVDLLKTDPELNSIIRAPALFKKILVQPFKDVKNLKENFKTALAVNLIEELPLLGLLFGKKKKGQGAQGTQDDKNYDTLRKTLRELKLISKALRRGKKELKTPTFGEKKSDKDAAEEESGAGTAVKKEKKQGVPLWLAGGLAIAALMVASKFTNFDGDTEDSQDVLGEDLPDKADEPKPQNEEDANKDISDLKVVSDELQEILDTLQDKTGIDEIEDLEELADKFDDVSDNADKEKEKINKEKEKFEKITKKKIIIEEEQPEDLDKPELSATTSRKEKRKVAAAKAKLTPSQLEWLGDADVTDSNIMSRMPAPQAGEQAVGPAPTPGAKPTPGTASDSQNETSVSSNEAVELVKSKIGADEAQWNIFRSTVAKIESGGKYDIVGGSNNYYDGKYQMGAAAKTDGARIAGVPDPGHSRDPNDPKRQAFRQSPNLQELLFAGFTIANHSYLQKNKKYNEKTTPGKLQTLGYAHNQGMGGAEQWLNTGIVGSDGFGTKGTKYTDDLRASFIAAGYDGEKNNTLVASSPSSGTDMVNASTDVSAQRKQPNTQTKVLVVNNTRTVSAS